jgi:hypothetical protein
MVAKRSARAERTQTINQARALILTGPDDLRARLTGHTAAAQLTILVEPVLGQTQLPRRDDLRRGSSYRK